MLNQARDVIRSYLFRTYSEPSCDGILDKYRYLGDDDDTMQAQH